MVSGPVARQRRFEPGAFFRNRLDQGQLREAGTCGRAGRPRSQAWVSRHCIAISAESYNPDRVALQLIYESYIWFGHSEESIPYKRETDDGIVSDTDAIAKIH
jgi:hypothetical protein